MLKALRLQKKTDPYVASSVDDLQKVLGRGIYLERSLLAMDKVMDGQINQAQRLLADKNNGVYGKIALGVLRFLEATVGFEPEAVQNAIHALGAAESAATKAKNDAQNSGLITSSFRPGAEFEMVEIESGLMGAVSMFLTESYIEALKALYKLRRTYGELEKLRKHVDEVLKSPRSQTADYSNTEVQSQLSAFRQAHRLRVENVDPDSAKTQTPEKTTDEYIISGVKACAGLLHLVLSSFPPNMGKLLSIVGIHGERSLALEMLWSAIDDFTNIHSSLALLALLQFFDGQFQYRDIQLPKELEDKISDKFAAPSGTVRTTAQMTPRELSDARERLYKALMNTRKLYPHGVLWLLQEGRMTANVDLARGIEILESTECGENQIRQVEGLLVFDRTFMLLSLLRLEEAAKNFDSLMELSTWSHPLYMYMAAGCNIELYRACEDKASPEALKYKDQAKKYLKRTSDAGGQKKILGKKMPFDLYVSRKVEVIHQQAAKHNLDVIDAVGTSPLYEAMYFWGCHTRMPEELVPQVLKALDYSKDAPLPESSSDALIRNLITAVYLRRVSRADEGMELLNSEVLPHVITVNGTGYRPKYHAQRDQWAGPVALYERAVYEWLRCGKDGVEVSSKSVQPVHEWLDYCANWDGDYELSTRVNMRLTGANDRLAIYRLQK